MTKKSVALFFDAVLLVVSVLVVPTPASASEGGREAQKQVQAWVEGAELATPAYAESCRVLRATVTNSQGLSGGTIQATVCKAPYSAHLDDSSYNYVQDHQADGVAARAWLDTSSGERVGPMAVDSTSTSGGTSLDSWVSRDSRPGTVRVYVCLGTTSPWDGGRCASASY